jgi:hypothetical protein
VSTKPAAWTAVTSVLKFPAATAVSTMSFSDVAIFEAAMGVEPHDPIMLIPTNNVAEISNAYRVAFFIISDSFFF